LASVVEILDWGMWRPLLTASTDPAIPRLPGLYSIRRIGRSDLDYIGQTSLRLGQRLGMLKGVYSEEMPYRDPHTAAPALWALRHAEGCDFEVSVVPVEGSSPWRKGLEALAIGLYRQEHEKSPNVQFGRVPLGYRASSANNARLVKLGRRFRGGPAPGVMLDSHALGIPPTAPLTGSPQEHKWHGLMWSEWRPLDLHDRKSFEAGTGLYRLRGTEADTLLYIGQGVIPDRPLAHLAKLRQPDHAQARIFSAQSRLEWSWVLNEEWTPLHRLELENDLIASHILQTGTIPPAQFLG
jgi:hypothetical protein